MTIRSKVPNEQYKENFDRIFRNKEAIQKLLSEQMQLVSEANIEQYMLEVSRKSGGID